MNEYVNITLDNIESEHLCCAISDKKHVDGVVSKKEWLKEQLQNGHVFRKLNAQGKVFIEYAPLEYAWTPISGEDYVYIYCLWVAGSYKGKGYANDLLNYAIEDAKKQGKNGLCVLTSKKKKPFMSEKAFFQKYGFIVVDEVGEYELLALKFNDVEPKINESARAMKIGDKTPTIFYSPQCPYVINCINEITSFAKSNNVFVNLVKIDTLKRAKEMPCIFNNWANFINGNFVSNTLLNKNSFEKLLKEK